MHVVSCPFKDTALPEERPLPVTVFDEQFFSGGPQKKGLDQDFDPPLPSSPSHFQRGVLAPTKFEKKTRTRK